MSAWRTISLWMDQLDEPLLARAALDQDLDVDVAIIGAGYTGLWTAYYLKRQAPNLNIAIVEAQTAGFGASGRNGGWLMGNVLGEDRLLADLPPEQRRASFDLLHGIPDEVGVVLEREGIDCDYRKGGALYCAARYPEQEASLRHYLDTLYSQGLTESDYRWLGPEQLAQQIRIAKPYGGIYAPHVATIHPAKLVRGLTYGQRTADNRLVFGARGGYQFAARLRHNFDLTTSEVELRRYLFGELFPQLKNVRITHAWGGNLGMSRRFKPHMLCDQASGIALSGGYGGEGVGASNLGGRTLADLILQRDTELVRQSWVIHGGLDTLRAWEPEPCRWLGYNAIIRSFVHEDQTLANPTTAPWRRKLATGIAGFMEGFMR
jgi:glycine/D-amino acid oxidase-like deaminating enzyme